MNAQLMYNERRLLRNSDLAKRMGETKLQQSVVSCLRIHFGNEDIVASASVLVESLAIIEENALKLLSMSAYQLLHAAAKRYPKNSQILGAVHNFYKYTQAIKARKAAKKLADAKKVCGLLVVIYYHYYYYSSSCSSSSSSYYYYYYYYNRRRKTSQSQM